MSCPYAEVIGDPIAHSKSPTIHNFWLRKLSLAGEYRAVRIPEASLAAYIAMRRADPSWLGCNVTMPLKQAILAHVDEVEPSAARCGAANCVYRSDGRVVATNTDVEALTMSLGMPELKDAAIVIGTGGAARAALLYLEQMNAIQVGIVSRRPAHARTLLQDFGLFGEAWNFDQATALPTPMLLINATPLGMRDHPPMPQRVIEMLRWFDSNGMVLDMVYDPLPTPLVAAANRLGLTAINGLAMLVDQARASFEHFFGTYPSLDHDVELAPLLT